MNKNLQKIFDIFHKTENLSTEEKDSVVKALKDTDKELEITAFKLERTEKVKKTTAILLEETIEELEQKRKAVEAQNRELEIEASLERVRAVAMSMNKSDDLLNICEISFKEFQKLGFDNLRNTIIHILNDEKGFFLDYDYSDYLGGSINNIRYNSHPIVENYLKQIKRADDAFAEVVIEGDQLDSWKDFRRRGGQPDDPKLDDIQALYYYLYSIGVGDIGISTFSPIDESQIKILKRFRNVFDLAYRTYTDITKAEAQAREAQIEAALERVRSKTMAMHNSHDVGVTVVTLFDEVLKLGLDKSIRCGIGILEGTEQMETWSATSNSNDKVDLKMGMLDMTIHPMLIGLKKAWKNGETGFKYQLTGNDVTIYYNALNNEPEYPFHVELDTLPEKEFHNSFFFSEGILFVFTANPISKEAAKVLNRFASVFGQTYRRYLDLQKAEAQAREAQIEASLERVRSRAMAIRKSDELVEVIQVIFQELNRLGFDLIECSIVTYDTNPKDLIYWSAGTYGSALPSSVKLQYIDHPLLVELFNDFESGIQYRSGEYSGDLLKTWWDRIFTETDFKYAPKEFIESWKKIDQVFYSQAAMNHGFLEFLGGAPLPDVKVEILKRFTNVVDLAYTRFDDVVKAEAQARESQIELALERVRARTMAMHKSDDLTSAVAIVFEELHKLGLKTIRCGVGIFDGKNRKINVWTSSSSEKSDSVQVSGDEMLEGHSLLDGIYDSWQRQQDYSYVLKGEDLTKYYNVVADSNLPVKPPEVNVAKAIQYYHCVMFPAGGLFAFRESEFSAEAIRLMRRFADVFHLTFIRHLDLKNAETQNIIIQAENERKTMELEEARQLQLSMLPKELPNLPNLDIAVYMQTATEVGGDYYDFQVGIDGTLTTIIGDATGHGMKAGTVVTITKSLFNSMAANENILGTFDKISQVIKGMKFRQLAMCLIMMKIRGNRLSMSSAAMPPALIYRAKNKTVEEILLKGMPLGTMKKFPYKKIEGHLNSGDKILLYSDGLPELANEKDQMFGYDRIITEFQSVGEKEPEEIVDHLKTSASQWVNGKEPDDDVTFVVIKVK